MPSFALITYVVTQTLFCNEATPLDDVFDVLKGHEVEEAYGVTFGHFGDDVLNSGLEQAYFIPLLEPPFGVPSTLVTQVKKERLEDFREAITAHLEKAKSKALSSLTIALNGHGSPEGLAQFNKPPLPHKELIDIIFDEIDKASASESLIINLIYDACHGKAMLPILQERTMKDGKAKYLVNFITSSDADKSAYGDFTMSRFTLELAGFSNLRQAEYANNPSTLSNEKYAIRNLKPLSYLGADFVLSEGLSIHSKWGPTINQINIWSSYDDVWKISEGAGIWPLWQKRASELVLKGKNNTGFSKSALLYQYIHADDAPAFKEAIYLWVVEMQQNVIERTTTGMKPGSVQEFQQAENYHFSMIRDLANKYPQVVEKTLIEVARENPIETIVSSESVSKNRRWAALRGLAQLEKISLEGTKALMKLDRDLPWVMKHTLEALVDKIDQSQRPQYEKFLKRLGS